MQKPLFLSFFVVCDWKTQKNTHFFVFFFRNLCIGTIEKPFVVIVFFVICA